MSANPETVMEGLKNFLKAKLSSDFPNISRTVKFWTDTSPQPFLGIRCVAQEDEYQGEGLPLTTLEVELWIYAQNKDSKLDNETFLNQLVAKLRTALVPQDVEEGPQTLNGLVYRARIEGRTTYDPGDLDKQSKATLTLKLLLPSYP